LGAPSTTTGVRSVVLRSGVYADSVRLMQVSRDVAAHLHQADRVGVDAGPEHDRADAVGRWSCHDETVPTDVSAVKYPVGTQ